MNKIVEASNHSAAVEKNGLPRWVISGAYPKILMSRKTI